MTYSDQPSSLNGGICRANKHRLSTIITQKNDGASSTGGRTQYRKPFWSLGARGLFLRHGQLSSLYNVHCGIDSPAFSEPPKSKIRSLGAGILNLLKNCICVDHTEVNNSSENQAVNPTSQPFPKKEGNKEVPGKKPVPDENNSVSEKCVKDDRLDKESGVNDDETEVPEEVSDYSIGDDGIAIDYGNVSEERIEDESPLAYKFYDENCSSSRGFGVAGPHDDTSTSSAHACDIETRIRRADITTSPLMKPQAINNIGSSESSVSLGSTSDYSLLTLTPPQVFATRNTRAIRFVRDFERFSNQVPFNPEYHADSLLMTPRKEFIPLYVSKMRKYRMDPKVVDIALTTLRRMATSDMFRKQIRKADGIKVLLDVMKRHSLRIRIQIQCCITLANLSYQSPKNKEIIIRSGGLGSIIGAMKVYSRNEHIQAWGCLALRNLMNHNSNSHQMTYHSLAAIDSIVPALESFPNCDVVQHNGMLALTSICHRSEECRQKIQTCGGFSTMVRCMERNLNAKRLCDVGLSCMKNLVADEIIQKEMGGNGGVQCIIVIMNQYGEDVGITMKCCAVLMNLAFRYENRNQIKQAGGIEAIVNALKNYKKLNWKNVCVFLKALSNSTFDCIQSKMLAVEYGGIKETLDIIKHNIHRSHHVLIEDGCRVLRNLLDGCFYNHQVMVEHDGVSIILDALEKHGGYSLGVAEHGVAVLMNLSISHRIAMEILVVRSVRIMTLAWQLVVLHRGVESVSK